MTTVIDALVMTLGLDPTDFIKGQNQVQASFDKTKQKVVKDSAEVEKAAAGMTEKIGKASTAFLELMGLFMGGVGFKAFVTGAIEANNALDRLSTGLGSSPELLSAWGTAARNMGGNAATTQASLQGLSDSLVDLRLQGKQLPMAFGQLNAIKSIDFSHGWEKMAIGLADASSILAKTDPAGANRLLRQFGIDPVTAALLIEQGPRMKAYLETMKKYAPSDADRAASKELVESRGKLAAATDLLASKVMTALAPAFEAFNAVLEKVIMALAKFVEQHPLVTDAIIGMITVMSGAVALKAIATIWSLTSALTALGTANTVAAGGGMLGLLGRLGVLGAVGATAGAVAGSMAYGESQGFSPDVRNALAAEGRNSPLYKNRLSGNDAIRRRGAGAGGSVSGRTTVDTSIPTEGRALLDTLASGEAKDYNVVNGGGTFSDFSKHPYAGMSTNRGGRAAGRYQDLPSTWAAIQRETGITDFSPASQDRGNWYLAQRDYKSRTGRDLLADLRDPSRRSSVGRVLSPTWVSLNSGFASKYDRFLGRVQGTPKPQHDSLWMGLPGAGGNVGQQVASLSTIANSTSATTTSNSNEAHIHGGVHIHVANGSDANAIAGHIDKAITKSLLGGSDSSIMSNTGLA